MTLGEIWEYVLEMSLRDNGGGYLSPDTYNRLLAQVNTEMFTDEYKKYENSQVISDSLDPFVITLGDSDETFLSITDGYVLLPADYRHLSSFRLIRWDNEESNGRCKSVVRTSKPGVVLNDDQFNYRRDSQLHAPSFNRAIATLQNSTKSQRKLRVLPDNEGYKVSITYLRLPATPFFDYTILDPSDQDYIEYLAPDETHDGTVLTNGTASRSVELEWPDQVHDLFAERILKKFSLMNENQRFSAIDENR